MPKITPLAVEGCLRIDGDRYHDNRGFFQELHNETKLPDEAKACKQISVSHSKKNVWRGLHTARYAKLVSCVQGKVLDFCVDLREESPTYLQWASLELASDVPIQIFVPARCGHGFLALEEDSIVVYAQTGTFNGPHEMDVNVQEPKFGIKLPVAFEDLVISDKDKNAPMLDEARKAWKERNPDLA